MVKEEYRTMGSQTPTGEIEGAELLVVCAVTTNAPGAAGDGILLGGARQSRITLDLCLIDARTSRLVAATTVQGKVTDWSVGIPLVSGVYATTSTDEGLRVMVDEAVRFVVSQTPAVYYRR
jgi:curli biogenesis system outer membrane secretion channel CsgG